MMYFLSFLFCTVRMGEESTPKRKEITSVEFQSLHVQLLAGVKIGSQKTEGIQPVPS